MRKNLTIALSLMLALTPVCSDFSASAKMSPESYKLYQDSNVLIDILNNDGLISGGSAANNAGIKNAQAIYTINNDGMITGYDPGEDDVFICAVGGKSRIECIDKILMKHGKFINIIHNTARIDSHARIGIGNTIGPYVSIGADAKVGDFNLIQNFAIISPP